GETDAQVCGVCDVCRDPPELYDATTPAQKALAAVQRLDQRFGRGRVVDHLTGRTKDVQDWEQGLSTWAIGADVSPNGWRDVIDHLLFEGLLIEDPNDGRPLIRLGDPEAVRAVYRGETRIEVRKELAGFDASTRSGNPRRRGEGRNMAAEAMSGAVRARFEALRAWRKDRAAEQRVPPYVIFHDKVLAEIAARDPGGLDALGRLPGVGAGKLDRYGASLLEALAAVN
ncbi:MAG: ATP-dependent DNA helicase RecQ, partial [Brevundimonas sp.]